MSNEERRTSLVLLTGIAVASTLFLMLTGCEHGRAVLGRAGEQYIAMLTELLNNGNISQAQYNVLLASWQSLQASVETTASQWWEIALQYLGAATTAFFGLKGTTKGAQLLGSLIAARRQPPSAPAAAA